MFAKPCNDFNHMHVFSPTWHSDGIYHWKECSCGKKSDVTSHTSSGANTASCTSKALCNVCQKVYGSVLAHTYDQQVLSSKFLCETDSCAGITTYYYSCVCGARGTKTFEQYVAPKHTYSVQNASDQYIQSKATCTSQARYYYSCVCGATATKTFAAGELLEHVYSDDWCISETSHWRECVCGEKSYVAEHSSSGDSVASCVMQAICDICQKTYGDFGEHTFRDDWLGNDKNHWRKCSCGEISAFSVHEDKDASGTCDVCNLKNKKDAILNKKPASTEPSDSASSVSSGVTADTKQINFVDWALPSLLITSTLIGLIVYLLKKQLINIKDKKILPKHQDTETKNEGQI